MEIPDWFLIAVFVRSRADELVRWRAVSSHWGAVITSRDLLLQRRRFGIPVEPLLAYNIDVLFDSPADGVVACYCPSSQSQAAVDATPPPAHAQPTEDIVAAPAPSSIPELEYDTIVSILLLCRATDLVLWRRVCRRWRGLICSPEFVLEHSLLRPRAPDAMLLLRRRPPRRLAELLAKPSVSTSTARPVAVWHIQSVEDIHTSPTSVPLFQIEGNHALLNVHGCADSVLLLSYSGHLFAVNPVTRRGVRLPPIHTDATILALFRGPAHEDSNPDYRVLFCNSHKPVSAYKTFAIATKETLTLAYPASSNEVETTLQECMPDCLGSRVVIKNMIYWQQSYSDMVLCFDANFSMFSLLHPPTVTPGPRIQLLELDGLLAWTTIADTEPTLDIYVHRSDWQKLYHIELPGHEIQRDADYYVVSSDGDILVESAGFVLHFDSSGVLLGRYTHASYNLSVMPYQLKKSLLPLYT